MVQCKNRGYETGYETAAWVYTFHTRFIPPVEITVSYPVSYPQLEQAFHTLFHALLSIVSNPVSYPVSYPVKVCCRNHADVSKGILKFHFQHVFSNLNVQLCYIPVACPVSYPAKASYPVSYPVMLRYVLEVKSGKSRAGWRLGRPGSKEPGRLQI